MTAFSKRHNVFRGSCGAAILLCACTISAAMASDTAVIAVSVFCDPSPPTGSISINAGASTTTSLDDATLTIDASDLYSGVTEMRFSNNGTDWSPWESYATTKQPWTLATGLDGVRNVYAQFKDGAGNSNTNLDIADSIIYDILPPTGSITINGGATYTNSTLVTLTLAALDSASGVAKMRFSNDGTTWTPADWASAPDYATSYTDWPLTSGDGSKTVYAQYRDNAGNVSTDTIGDDITLDTMPPNVQSIAPANPGDWQTLSGPTNDDDVNFTVTFDENIGTFNAAAITVTGAGAGVAQTPVDTGDHKTWTVTVAGITGDSALSIAVNAGADVKDSAGNNLAIPAASSPDVLIDNTPPTPEITGETTLINTTRTLTINFGEVVNGFALGMVLVSNGTANNLQPAIAASSYTVDVLGSGTVTVSASIATSVVTDNAGNPNNPIAEPFTYPFDDVAPTASITLDDPTPTGLDMVHFSVNFSESVGTSFTNAEDVTVTGTLAGTPELSGTDPNYTVAVTLSAPDANGTVGINVGTMVTDLANNPYAGNTSPMYTIVHDAPVPVAGLIGLGALLGLVTIAGARKMRKK